MPEEQDNQIEPRAPGGINRISETARRGIDAARYVAGLVKAQAVSGLPNIVSTDRSYDFLLKWGTKGSDDGQFNTPRDVAAAPDGSVYVADYGNHRTQRFTTEGVFVGKWASPGLQGEGEHDLPAHIAVAYGIPCPSGVAVASDGSVYVADYHNHRIQKFSPSGEYLTRWGSLGSGDGEFHRPNGVAVDGSGNVYVADSYNQRIQKFSPSGEYLTKWGAKGSGPGQFNRPEGIAFDGSGNVYVADSYNHRIQKFTSDGVFVSGWGTNGSGDGEFKTPAGVAVASDGSVYVADSENNRIQKFSVGQ
jgi:sugar lactone lactonase YvrE